MLVTVAWVVSESQSSAAPTTSALSVSNEFREMISDHLTYAAQLCFLRCGNLDCGVLAIVRCSTSFLVY